MSSATLEAPHVTAEEPSPAPFVCYAEEYRCPRCESIIPATCVKREEPTDYEKARGQRTISIYCGRCCTGFAGRFVLADGLLRALGISRLLPDEMATLRAEIGVVTGDLSLPAAAAAEAKPAIDYPALLDQAQAVQKILVAALQRIAHYRAAPAGTHGEELSMRTEICWVAQRALDAARCEDRGERSTRPVATLGGVPAPAAEVVIDQIASQDADQARGEPAPLPRTDETRIDRSTSQLGPDAPDPFDQCS